MVLFILVLSRVLTLNGGLDIHCSLLKFYLLVLSCILFNSEDDFWMRK